MNSNYPFLKLTALLYKRRVGKSSEFNFPTFQNCKNTSYDVHFEKPEEFGEVVNRLLVEL